VASLQRLVVPSAQWQAEGLYLLPHQSHYLTHVLRLRPGQHFVAMDGQGRCWLAVLTPNPAQAKLVEAIALTRELPISVIAVLPGPTPPICYLVFSLRIGAGIGVP